LLSQKKQIQTMPDERGQKLIIRPVALGGDGRT
jgi:hypothetical protein